MNNHKLKRAMQSWWVSSEKARWIYGKQGRINFDGTVTVDADRQGFRFVTLDTGTLTIARNVAGVPNRAGLPVRLRQEQGVLIIDGQDDRLLEGDSNAPSTVFTVNSVSPDSHGNVLLDPDDLDDTSTTHKFTTAADISKLAGIAAGAEVNVNADWNAVSGDALILNKPTIPTLPVKATGAEVDTGTDDAKFVTPKAMEDSSYIKAAYADAKVADAIADSVTTVAPSQNAVFDALALKQTLDTTLTGIASLGTAADKMLYTTGVDTWAELATLAYGRSLLGATNIAAAQTILALVPGTNVQAFDATLLSIAALGTAADRMLYTTGVDTWAELTTTSYGRAFLALANAAALAPVLATSAHGATLDTTPLDADEVVGMDSSASFALIRTTWTSIKAFLKTYFDTLYNLYVHPNHTGDVTSVGDGATTIVANAVTTTKIINDAVTFAKMQNIATDSLIGRDTAATGDPENILLGASLSMDGSGNLQRAALTGDVTAAANSNATTIANDAVTNAKAANMANATVKGRTTAGTGDPEDLTMAQLVALIEAQALYALLAGRSGGQTLNGDTASGGNLTLMSTAHATKGKLLFGTSAYDEVNNRLGIGTATPLSALDVRGVFRIDGGTVPSYPASGAGFESTYDSDVAAGGAAGSGTSIFQSYDRTGAAWRDLWLRGAVVRIDNDGALALSLVGGAAGIGVAAPAAQLDVLQPTLGSRVLQIGSVATNDDPTEFVIQQRITTSGVVSNTTLMTIPIPTSALYHVNAFIQGRRTGGAAGAGTDGGVQRTHFGCINNAGSLSFLDVGPVYESLSTPAATFTSTATVSGTNILIRVSNSQNSNVSWHVTVHVFPLVS